VTRVLRFASALELGASLRSPLVRRGASDLMAWRGARHVISFRDVALARAALADRALIRCRDKNSGTEKSPR
jgi:hypothetical protein